MKYISSFLKLVALFIFQFTAIGFSQNLNPRLLFEEGLILYKNGNFEMAGKKFQTVVTLPQPNAYVSLGTILLAKTYLNSDDFDHAAQYADQHLRAFPRSTYRADAHYILASACMKLGKFNEAMEHLARAIENSASREFVNQCQDLASAALLHPVSAENVYTLHESNTWKKADPYILFWLANLYYLENSTSQCDSLLEELERSRPDPDLLAKIRNFVPLSEKRDSEVRIGVILPVTGYFADDADDFLRGLALAIKERKRLIPEIKLFLKDSRGTNVGAAQATLDFHNKKIDVLIGELEDSRSVMIAGIAANSNIPLIVPVATENGISSIGKYIFQTNSDLETRGAAAAEYGINELHMRTFATLAPADEYGHSLTDAFTNKVDQLGGTIVTQQWYYPGTQDFKNQFIAIRNAGFRYAYRDTLLQQGLTIQSAKIDSMFRRKDRLIKMNSDDEKGLLETIDVAVTAIDGFFCPMYAEDIELLAPQLALYNLHTRLLGGENWVNKEMLRKQRNYVNGAVFFAGNYVTEIDILYRNFENKFRTLTKKSPGIMAIYGYNIMKFLSEAIDADNTSGAEIAAYLEQTPVYSGIGGNISFYQSNHVNRSVNMLLYQDGNIVILKQ